MSLVYSDCLPACILSYSAWADTLSYVAPPPPLLPLTGDWGKSVQDVLSQWNKAVQQSKGLQSIRVYWRAHNETHSVMTQIVGWRSSHILQHLWVPEWRVCVKFIYISGGWNMKEWLALNCIEHQHKILNNWCRYAICYCLNSINMCSCLGVNGNESWCRRRYCLKCITSVSHSTHSLNILNENQHHVQMMLVVSIFDSMAIPLQEQNRLSTIYKLLTQPPCTVTLLIKYHNQQT